MRGMSNYKDLMTEFASMINTADKQLAIKLISKDTVFYTPVSLPLCGSDGCFSIVYLCGKLLEDVLWNVEEIIEKSSKIAIRWSCTGTPDGIFIGVAPDGKKFITEFMNFYYFDNNGKITNDVASSGIVHILIQIGLLRLND